MDHREEWGAGRSGPSKFSPQVTVVIPSLFHMNKWGHPHTMHLPRKFLATSGQSGQSLQVNFVEGGVVHMEECATGRSGPLGSVWLREEWDTWRSGPQGGVGHKEEWGSRRYEPHGGLGHR